MMKSNKKSRSLLGLVLAVALAVGCCLTTSAFAATNDAELTANINSDGFVVPVNGTNSRAYSEEQTITLDANTIQVSHESSLSSSVEEQTAVDDTITNMGIMPLASGELAANQGYTYGSVTVGAGKTITVSATYTPTNATMRIGYANSSGTVTYVNISGGVGSHTFKINTAGTYSIYVYNSSSYDVEYSVSYIAT